jgi:choline-sulfatase
MDDPDTLRRVTKGYYGLITHIDRQIGEVLGELEAIDMDEPRLIYTSDHGEMLGAQGLFGKSCVYEEAIRVPLIISGPDIPKAASNQDLVSHVDLFQTLLDSVGVAADPHDVDLPGSSLLGAIPKGRRLFAEYHATGTTGAAFVLRQGEYKLIYYVGYPNELFDIVKDPGETSNLAGQAAHMSKLDNLVGVLRSICDPEEVDRQAKAAQQNKIDEYGGREAIIRSGTLVYTPPPGKDAEVRDIA